MSGPDAQRARAKYRRLAGGYDRRIVPTAPLRRRAIERLGLASGDTVVDVACGTGVNFPLIEERIGPSGRLIGH
jgi:ubiquinone/menaquinone biosynthesis C-methylase UbiE